MDELTRVGPMQRRNLRADPFRTRRSRRPQVRIALCLSLTMTFCKRVSSDEYKMKGVEEVKYMKGEENRVNARNQENLVRHTFLHAQSTHTHTC